MTSTPEDPTPEDPTPEAPSPQLSPSDDARDSGLLSTRPFVALATLGTASALWAIFLWRELILARAGETPFCGFGESADCGSLWEAAFASWVHQATGLPVAGWGTVWGLVATLLPLAALSWGQRGGAGRSAPLAAVCSAIDLTAAGGVVGIVVLLAASAQEGLFCTSCALTYVLTLAYAGVAFFGLRQRPIERSPHGVTVATAATAAVFLALLFLGPTTPRSLDAEGRRALASLDDGPVQGTPADTELDPDVRLRKLLASLPPQGLQGLADSLHLWNSSAYFPPEEPRALALGEPGATVRVSEFTDVLCGHCARLHETLDYVATLVSPESFSVDSRHFPLDGRCNRYLAPRDDDDVRCVAARAQICVEPTGRVHDFAGALFEHQEGLTAQQVFELAEPFIDRAALDQCLTSEATESALAADVDYAWRYSPRGTPLVLLEGRQSTQFGPFIYAMILTRGRADHPAFANLPAPRPPQDHHGHDHG